jgi:hypothetical protein
MKLRVLNYYIGLWTFWFETYEEDKELIFDEDYCYFFINAKKRAKEIANETGRVVIIRKTKSNIDTFLEDDPIYPSKKGD